MAAWRIGPGARWTPGPAVQRAAREALDARAAAPRSRKAGTRVGLQVARDLAAGRTIGADRSRQVARFLSRNRRFARSKLDTKAGQAWGFWGGSPAVNELRRLGVLRP